MTEDVLNKLIKINFDPKELEKYRVDPAAELQKLQDNKIADPNEGTGRRRRNYPDVQPYDVSKIDRA